MLQPLLMLFSLSHSAGHEYMEMIQSYIYASHNSLTMPDHYKRRIGILYTYTEKQFSFYHFFFHQRVSSSSPSTTPSPHGQSPCPDSTQCSPPALLMVLTSSPTLRPQPATMNSCTPTSLPSLPPQPSRGRSPAPQSTAPSTHPSSPLPPPPRDHPSSQRSRSTAA